MANELKGQASIKALGQTWTASLPFKVAKALKREHDIDLMSSGADLGNIDVFEVVLTAMLTVHHPDITETQVEDILTELGLRPVLTAITPALASFTGVKPKELAEAIATAEAGGAARP